MAYGAFFEMSEVVNAYIALIALGDKVAFSLVLSAVPVMILAANIPVTISGIGAREASLEVLLAGVAETEVLVAAAFLISVIEYIIPTLIGLPFLPLFIRESFPKDLKSKAKGL